MSTDIVTGRIDWDDLPRWLSQLDAEHRARLSDALHHTDSADHDRLIVDIVRAELAMESPDREAVAVVFGTTEWDKGYFLESSGLVLYRDRSTDEVDFCDIDEIFTDEFGAGGASFGLSVHLRTGEIATDDYINNLYDSLGYPFPGRR